MDEPQSLRLPELLRLKAALALFGPLRRAELARRMGIPEARLVEVSEGHPVDPETEQRVGEWLEDWEAP